MPVPWLGGERPTLGLALWEQLFRVQTGALATLQQRSVTIVHGEADAWVDPAEAALLAAILRDRGAPATIAVRGAGHDLVEAPPTVFRDLAADLRARLQPRRMPTVLLSLESAPSVSGLTRPPLRYDAPAVTYPQPGEPAPTFAMSADDGSLVTSESLSRPRYVLYFYPKDDTTGCTAQACGLRDSWDWVESLDAEIFGVSPDSVASHVKFRDKYGLRHRLLADEGHTVADAYGTWVDKDVPAAATTRVSSARPLSSVPTVGSSTSSPG